jgi:hypothetical protein
MLSRVMYTAWFWSSDSKKNTVLSYGGAYQASVRWPRMGHFPFSCYAEPVLCACQFDELGSMQHERRHCFSLFFPSDSILLASRGFSGLWSSVKATAFNPSPESCARTTLESPTLATNIWRPRIITTDAVVPAVLGVPYFVLGQESIRRKNDLSFQET